MRDLRQRIKWAYQRARYGWDDTALWGLDSHFQETVVPPLKKFCERYIALDGERHRLNPERTEVCRHTLELINKLETEDYEEMFNGTNISELAIYFANNIGYYWD